MSLRIDTQGRIEAVRFQNQTGSPATPAAGYSLLYITTNGLYMETESGAVIGPFVTGTAAAPAGGRTLISELTPAGTGTASFTSIPGTYTKLTLEGAIRSTQAAAMVQGGVHFNADTTAGNYRYIDGYNYGTTSAGGDGGADAIFAFNAICAGNSPAGEFTQFIMQITQYANTNFNKYAITNLGHRRDTSSVHLMRMNSVVDWGNTAAITQIDIYLSAGNFAANSVLRLYGEN